MAVFTNQATLTYNGLSLVSNVTTGQILETLAVAKATASETYTAGEKLVYTVSITNSGTAPYENVTLGDDLGTFAEGSLTLQPLTYDTGSVLYYINGVLQPAPSVTAGPPLTFSGITVPAGGSAILVYSATVNEYAPLGAGASITNTVTATDADGDTVTSSATVNAAGGAVLSIEKTLSPLTVAENGQVTYTMTVYNYGGAEAETEANPVITDSFAPPLTSVTATYNGAPWSAGTDYTYSELTGVFTTSDGAITVPAAAFSRDPVTGVVTVTPGTATVAVTGTVS